jgi:puromycin-sensitive aminopeptidase
VFAITLVVPEDLTAVSNAPVVRTEPAGPGKVAVAFADTMVMSPYLVAFIVGDLEATDPVIVDGVPLRILHVPGKSHLTGYALEVGAFALGWFAEYYGIPYPEKKLDMIAIPDFAWGAMENVGAITYRESALLIDTERSTQQERSRVADVICHEIAHMWFGDLVTMKWWNGIWLNEAFATFMEMKCADAFRPDWQRWITFATEPLHGRSTSMDIDALEATRPIEVEVASPDEANAMFDSLTYGKGAAVLRMLEQFLGEGVFRRGVSEYLAKFAHGNTDTADLWDALERVSGRPVADIMSTWIYQGGFPVIEAAVREGAVALHQEQFRYGEPGDARWQVPLLRRPLDSDVVEPSLLGAGATVPLPAAGIVLNAGGHGYYRVRYSRPLFEHLLASLDRLDALERYGLVADTWAFVLAGEATATSFLDVASRLHDERQPVVWEAIVAGLDELHRILDDPARADLARFTVDLLRPTADRLGWDPAPGEDDLTGRLRGVALRGMGIVGEDAATRARARDLLERWMADASAVSGEVAATALTIVAASGDSGDYERFAAAYREAATPQDEARFLAAMAAIPDPDLAERMFGDVLARRIRNQDAPGVVARLIGNRVAGPHAWRLYRTRFEELAGVVPGSTLRRTLDHLPFRSEPEVAADIRAFLTEREVPGGARYAAQQLERLDARVRLRTAEETRSRAPFC